MVRWWMRLGAARHRQMPQGFAKCAGFRPYRGADGIFINVFPIEAALVDHNPFRSARMV